MSQGKGNLMRLPKREAENKSWLVRYLADDSLSRVAAMALSFL